MSADRPRVVVTRGAGGASDLAARLTDAGFHVVPVPLIETVPTVTPGTVAGALRAAAGGWVVVTSAYAATLLADAAAGVAGEVVFAAVGEATADALRAGFGGVEVVVSDAAADAEALAETLRDRVRSRPVLVIAAEDGRRTLAPALRAAGGDVAELVAYRTGLPPSAPSAFRAALAPLPAALVFASGSAARHAATIVEPGTAPVACVLCIGPHTAAAAGAAGWANVEVAETASDEGVVATLRARLLGD